MKKKQPKMRQDAVAIIGMAMELPKGVNDTSKLWEFIARARHATGPIPKKRFDAAGFYHPNRSKAGHFNVRGGSFLDEVAAFDAPFFNISEEEAKTMDPQHRLLLECSFRALENAGIALDTITGSAKFGVFVGASKSDYDDRMSMDPYTTSQYSAIGPATTMFSNRISYFFNLRGPSVAVDTACSSSLTALHYAVESIRNGECESAIVGSSFLQLSPLMLTYMSTLGTLGVEGTSFAFDQRANGYGRGEGAVCIVLKGAQDAIRSKDVVRAMILNTGINHCGRSQGITFPNGEAQSALIDQVYRAVGLDPRDTLFVEGHGTGTQAGDPIEAKAIAKSFCCMERSAEHPLYLGSVKSNFGHLEGASGILAVIKCVLMLEKRVLLPNANFERSNPAFDLESQNLKVLTKCVPLPEGKIGRISLNNFGFGGSNAHAILEEAPKMQSTIQTENCITEPPFKKEQHCPQRLYLFSAKDETALKAHVKRFGDYLSHDPDSKDHLFMHDLSFTLCCRRTHFPRRVAMTAATRTELLTKLQGINQISRVSTSAKLGFVFTGQGSQWPRMGLDLMRYPEFSQKIQTAERCLKGLGASWSLIEEISRFSEKSIINTARISQPAVTALQIALVSLLSTWGVNPSAVIGHSSGEIAAAFAAGLLDLPSCLAIAYYRGVAASEIQGSEEIPAGAMMAVGADSNCLEPLLESLQSGFAVIACFNSPDSVTISGDRAAVEELASMLEEKGIFHRMLKVDVAYHSDHMLGGAKGYLNNIAPILERCPAATPKATMFSSVNGLAVIPKMARSPWYWVSNLINPVQFSTALGTMASAEELRSPDGSITLVEIGPHATLGSPVRQILSQPDIRTQIKAAHVLSAMKRGQNACTVILETVASLVSRGVPVDCAAVGSQTTDPLKSKLLVDLPPYSFNKTRRYWHESRLTKNFEHGTTAWNILLGHNMPSTLGQDLQFRNVFKLDDVPWVADHVINEVVVFPMAGYISAAIEAMVLASSNQTQEVDAFHLREVRVGKALALSTEGYHELFTILKPAVQGTRSTALTSSYDFQILSWTHDIGFSEHCKGSISLVMREAPESVSQTSTHSARALWMNKMRGKIESAASRDIEAAAFYQKASQVGLQYGPSFRLMSALRAGEDCAVGIIRCDETRSKMPMQYETALKIHPTILDACFHVGLSNGGDIDLLSAQVPTFFPEIIISNKLRQNLGDELQVYCQHLEKDKMSRSARLNIFCFDGDSEEIPVIEIRDGRVFDIGQIDAEETVAEATNPCRTEWTEWSSQLATSAFEDSEPVSEEDLEAPILNEEVTLITEKLPLDGLIGQLAKYVGAGNSIQHLPMAAACHKSEGIFICLDEIWQPVLTQMDAKKFEALRNLVTTASGILWVTRSNAQAPLSDFAFGFARSLRLENLGLKFVVLQLEANSLSATNIAKVFEHAFVQKPGVSDSDVDYKEVDGQIQVPRLVPDNNLYRYLDQETNKSRTEVQPFWQDGRPLEITMSTVGLFSSIHFQDSESVDMTRPLEDNEVLIEIRATGMNFKDVLIALGSIPWQSIGRECSGHVLAAGAGTEFKKGDSVIHCGEALFATHARCKSQTVIKMPKGMTYEEAASVPIVYSTAYECLVEVARLQPGEKVLIHAASGGVGQAAIMLAQWIGAEIFVTVGTTEKKEFIMRTYGIPEDHIFSSRSTSFARALLAATDSSGVDVVLNSLAGEMLKSSWHCLAPFGRFVEIGKKDALANMQLDMSPFDIGVSYTAVDLSLLIEKRVDYFHRLMGKVMALFNAAVVKPVHPIKCISIADLEVGLRTMQTGKHMGKIVVVNDENASVQARCKPVRSSPIRADGSYIITGGTGGLGRSLAQWLVEKGAKNIILASRSGGVGAKLEELVKLGLAANAKVQIVKCDVGSVDDVKRLVEVARHDAPVRGLVHSAMVLKDATLENTSWNDWQPVLGPKVFGAINLHNALCCQPLDFFICLSSMTGIFGIPGQTSYGGSNTFLDAFCRWRGLQNLPAASISLPAVSDIGYVAENITHGNKDKTDNIYGCSITGAQVQLLVQAAAETGMFNLAMNSNHTTPGISMRPNSVLRSKLETPMLSHLRKLYSASSLDPANAGDSAGRKGPSLKDLLARETDYTQAFQLVANAVVQKIGSIMMLPIEDVTLDKPLADIGLDSLVAVEFRNWMVKELGAKIPLLDIMNSGSLGHLIEKLMRLSTFVIANERSDISRKEDGEEEN